MPSSLIINLIVLLVIIWVLLDISWELAILSVKVGVTRLYFVSLFHFDYFKLTQYFNLGQTWLSTVINARLVYKHCPGTQALYNRHTHNFRGARNAFYPLHICLFQSSISWKIRETLSKLWFQKEERGISCTESGPFILFGDGHCRWVVREKKFWSQGPLFSLNS